MKVRFLYLGINIILLLTLVSGCMANPTGDHMESVADQITEGILLGMNEDNYKKFSANFDQTMKENLNEEKFKTVILGIKAKIGDYVSKTYLQTETKDQYTVVSYKAKFSQEDNDVIVRTVLSEHEGKIYVAGFWLDSPNLRK